MGIAPRVRALGATLALALGLVLLLPVGPAAAATDVRHSQSVAALTAAVANPAPNAAEIIADAGMPPPPSHHLLPPPRVRDALDTTSPTPSNLAVAASYPRPPAGEALRPDTEAVDTTWARGPPTEELV